MLYSDLKTTVALYLNRPNMQDNDIAAMVGVAHGKIQRVLKTHTRNIIRANYTQPANNSFLPLPIDLLQLIGLFYNGLQLMQFPATSLDLASYRNGFVDKGTCLELYPTPSEDTEYRLDYYGMLAAIDTTNDSSTNWVLSFYPDIYVYAVLAEAAIFYRDDSRHAAWNQEFIQRISELMEQGWGQNLSTLPEIKCG